MQQKDSFSHAALYGSICNMENLHVQSGVHEHSLFLLIGSHAWKGWEPLCYRHQHRATWWLHYWFIKVEFSASMPNPWPSRRFWAAQFRLSLLWNILFTDNLTLFW